MRHDARTIHTFEDDTGKSLVEITLQAGKVIQCTLMLKSIGAIDMPVGEFVDLSATLSAAATFLAELGWEDDDEGEEVADGKNNPPKP